MRCTLLALALLACDQGAPDCADADQDGFNDAACGGSDCDDTDPDIRPDAMDEGDEWTHRKLPGRGTPRAVVTPDGELWLAYVRAQNYGDPTDARVGRWNGTDFDWQTPPIRMPMLDMNLQMGVGSDGVLHLLFNNSAWTEVPYKTMYSTLDDGTWTTFEPYDATALPSYPSQLAVGIDGEALIALPAMAGEGQILSLTDPETPELHVPAYVVEGLHLGTQGDAVVVTRLPESRLNVALMQDGDQWIEEPLHMLSARTSYDLDEIVAVGLIEDSEDLVLHMGTGPGARVETIGSARNRGHSLAMGDDGTVHVVWHTPQNVAKYKSRAPDGTWSEDVVFGVGSHQWPREARVAALPGGEVHVWHNGGTTSADYHINHHILVPGDGVDNDCDGNGG